MRTLIPHTENGFCSSSGNAAVVVVVPVEEEDEEIDWINSWLLPFVGTQRRGWLVGLIGGSIVVIVRFHSVP